LGEYRGPEDARIFLKYAAARLNERLEAAAFRAYLADALLLISKGKTWDERWSVIRKPEEPKPEKDQEEIKSHILKGLKGLST
jgi:hypothetical protein